MSGALTITDIIALLTLFSLLGGLWWRIEAAITKVREDGDKRIAALAEHVSANNKALADFKTELADYKTEVAKEYARNGYLRDVEERVIKRIDSIASDIHGLRQEIGDAVKLWAASAKRTR